MPPIEWNGPDLKYVVTWERTDGEKEDSGNSQVDQPDVYHLVIPDSGSHGIYKPFKVTVKAKNTVGESRVPPEPVYGFSGEDSKLTYNIIFILHLCMCMQHLCRE